MTSPKKKRWAAIAGFISLLLGLTMTNAAMAQGIAKAAALGSIVVTTSETGVKLTGRAAALSDVEVDALMSIEKSGASGRMSTSQGGSFSLKAGESADVATVGISLTPGDKLSVELTLKSNDRELSSSTLSVGQ
ncbi:MULTISPECIES: curli-like amyloid fiber formation chaperone CsgH [Aurantimonas]|uniref:Copper-binding protein n=1 Tax=Aurantimonas marianensis TaxID=2920428 RepID=A0A9X2H2I4_9HYPH|nr:MULTISPECIES: curli-like amyloid fiber formation chaperone CsgH [Aurantimonas]MCP3054450.1 hypothetical protein [Aurantimonas marianensis]